MSKKKGDVPKKAVLLGRIGTNLKCGVVGLPNVGLVALKFLMYFRKSTFFNILTKSQVPAENFPFCTINPNESRFIHINKPIKVFKVVSQFQMKDSIGFVNITNLLGEFLMSYN